MKKFRSSKLSKMIKKVLISKINNSNSPYKMLKIAPEGPEDLISVNLSEISQSNVKSKKSPMRNRFKSSQGIRASVRNMSSFGSISSPNKQLESPNLSLKQIDENTSEIDK